MADEVELLHDGEGLAVVGEQGAVMQFLEDMGLQAVSQELRLDGLGSALDTAACVAESASRASAASGRYLKLTEESASEIGRLGLVPTSVKGVSYAMVGRRGSIEKWVQVETGVTSWLANPAILSGAAGIMAQLARQQEMKTLTRLLESIDGKLDDVRRRQRDEVLSKMDGARLAIEEAVCLREHGGDLEAAWGKIVNTKEVVLTVEGRALREIEALSDKVDSGDIRRLGKTTDEVTREVTIWLAVLARCFHLEDQHAILELEHVRATAPSRLDRHRLGLEDALRKRREKIVKKTGSLLSRLDEAGGVAGENVILHWHKAQAVVNSVNAASGEIDEFHALLDIETRHDPRTLPRWREALRDPQQWLRALDDAKPWLATGAGAVAAVGLGAVLASSSDSTDAEADDDTGDDA